jgi:cob(I)alamin adenosyltransferase
METARLAELRAEASLALNSAFKDTYRTLSDATEKTDSLVKGNVNATTQARINKARAQIDEILKLWEFLANDTSGDNSAILTAIQNDLPAIQAYLNELTGIVGGLTAGNSGLTQAQITQLQSAVSSATQEVTTSTTVLVTAQTNVTGNTSSTPNQNTQTPVQQQQNVVNDIQDVIDDIENEIEETGVQPPTQPYNQIQAVTGATSNSSGYYGSSDTVIQSQSGQIIYPPNPAPVRRVPVQNGPSLIEGENDE